MCWTTTTGAGEIGGQRPEEGGERGRPSRGGADEDDRRTPARRPCSTGAGRDAVGGETALAEPAAGMGDDADPAGDAEVARERAGVDGGPEALGAGRDAVDRAGGERLGGALRRRRR